MFLIALIAAVTGSIILAGLAWAYYPGEGDAGGDLLIALGAVGIILVMLTFTLLLR